MAGAGFAPAGFSPAGTGSVATATAMATDNLIDDRGAQQSARAIDPATGQYVLRSTGRSEGMPRVRQLVLIRVRTVLGSSAIAGLGVAQVGGDNTVTAQRRLQGTLEQALSDLVKAKLVAIVSVTLSSDVPTRLRAALKWRDLTTNQEFIEPL